MKKTFLYGTLAASLFVNAACTSAPAPTNTANKPANTNTAVVTNTNTAANTTTTNTNTAATNANSGSTGNSASTTGGDQDFKLNNQTGVEIHALYVAPSDSDDWEKDILGRDTLPSGESLEITFDRDEKAAMWDLRVEAKDGSFIVWENLNLMEISDVTLNYKDGKATAITK
jgi:hypothetical protein